MKHLKLFESYSKINENIKPCHSCEVMNINGKRCHEQGCPESWKDEKKECKWCGNKFVPEQIDQKFCDDDCAEAYNS